MIDIVARYQELMIHIQDMYSLLYLPYPLTAWVAVCFAGPALGPLLSGFAVYAENWRW
jgi:DHA1 family multidrug resistance protein-like MFS transporter